MVNFIREILLFMIQTNYKIRRFFIPKEIKYNLSFDFEFNKTPYNRTALINILLKSKSIDATYLEIGCNDDSNFNSIYSLNKIGVDPRKGGTHRMTSDVFFASNKSKFDVIFIDGYHTYQQVKIDTINAAKNLNSSGEILSHDFLPQNWYSAVPNDHKRLDYIWNGDCWKFAFELVEMDIDFKIINIDEGIMVIDSEESIIKIAEMDVSPNPAYETLQFDFYYKNFDELPITSYLNFVNGLKMNFKEDHQK